LAANLGALKDALGEISSDELEVVMGSGGVDGSLVRKKSKAKLKSLESKKGLVKRMDRVNKSERERFGKNLAILERLDVDQGNEVDGKKSVGSGLSKWEVLRAHIKSGMDS
jgi:hypothetical protein